MIPRCVCWIRTCVNTAVSRAYIDDYTRLTPAYHFRSRGCDAANPNWLVLSKFHTSIFATTVDAKLYMFHKDDDQPLFSRLIKMAVKYNSFFFIFERKLHGYPLHKTVARYRASIEQLADKTGNLPLSEPQEAGRDGRRCFFTPFQTPDY